ncbi:MAG: FtsW/RodA/SpoVE family cell cycle protein [Myxococcota bacterium]
MIAWLERLALAAIGAAVAWGVSIAPRHALAEAADRAGELARTPDQVLAASWQGFALWAAGVGLLALGRFVSVRRGAAIAAGAWLVPALALATGLGLVLQLGYGDPLHADGWPGERYADGVLLGGLVGGALLAARLDLGEWIERAQVALVVAIVGAFVALALFGSGPAGSDARIHLGPIQPLEGVKVAFVLFLAGTLGRRSSTIRWHRHHAWGGLLRMPRPRLLLPALAVLGVLFAGLFLVRDLGPTLVLSAVFLVVLYLVTGSPGWVGAAVGSVALGVVAIALQPEVVGSERVAVRLRMWTHPWLNGIPNGDQLAASRWAIAAGGLDGLGLGAGRAIPAGHTDLAIAHLAEELGFVGVCAYLGALVAIVGAGLVVAGRNRTPERMLAAGGLSLLLAAQAAVILGGTTGALPLTGIVAPFLSSGRTSTTVFVILVAMLAKLAEQGQVRADTEVLAEMRRTIAGAGLGLGALAVSAACLLFVEGVVLGPATSARGVVTTLADGTIAVRYDPRVQAIADRIQRGSLLDREGRVLVGTDADNHRTWPLGRAFGTLAGPAEAEVLRPQWSLERVWDERLRGYPERDDGPAVWLSEPDGRLLFAVPSRVERPGDRARAEAMAPAARLLPLPSPDLTSLVRLLRAPDAEIERIAHDAESRSVRLTIDAELQQKASEILAHWSKNAEAGAAVVVDVDSGEVLARAQVPDYDPSEGTWRKLVWDHDPVFTGVYGGWTDKTGPLGTAQAGSIAKLVTAAAAARTGAITFEGQGCDVRATPRFGCVERDRQGPMFTRDGWTKPIHDHAKDPTHGEIDLVSALAVSCNVYFGQLGLELGPEPLQELVAAGLELGWSDTFEPGPAESRTLASTAFGQGSAAMSPIQAARMVAMIGGGGVYRRCSPDLALTGPCEATVLVPDERSLVPILAGMQAAMTRGTGRGLAIDGVRVYGKTGTADAIGVEAEGAYGIAAGDRDAPTHSWFVAFAEPEETAPCEPRTGERLAVAVLISRGGSGRGAAAPAAIDLLRSARDLGYLTPTVGDAEDP